MVGELCETSVAEAGSPTQARGEATEVLHSLSIGAAILTSGR